VDNPRLFVITVVVAAFLGGTLVAAGYEYPLGLAAGCGLLAAAGAVVLNLRVDAPYLLRLLVIVPLGLAIGVFAIMARVRDLPVSAPFLALALTVAVQLAMLKGARRRARSSGPGD
jgi:uncharacterized membrane protein AbrB (regulator of aidB expression)